MERDDLTTVPVGSDLPPDEQERLAKILDDYLVAAERGAPIAPAELLRQHPADAQYLRSYLSGLQIFHEAVRPPHDLGVSTSTTPEMVGPGRTVADFNLLREIGRGGMGVVYEAMQTSLRRRVALKVLPFSSAHDAKQISRFRNEAQAAAQVRHPNIVPVYAVGEERGIHYYAMQLVDGQSLASLLLGLRGGSDSSPTGDTTVPNNSRTLHGHSIPVKPRANSQTSRPATSVNIEAGATAEHVRTVTRWGIEAAEALHAAHEYGVIHRDVKPSNLLLDEQGKLWVTDFGLARCREGANLTQTGDILGTMRYMSPEQALGRNGLVDHRTDVYSLGVTLYELAALRHPADEVGDLQLFFDRTMSNYRPLRHWNRHIPRDFETIVMKAIAEFPHERYATAQELADDLARLQVGRPILASPPNIVSRASKWAKRHRAAVVAAIAVAAMLIVSLAAGLVIVAHLKAHTDRANVLLVASRKQSDANLKRARQMLDRFGSRLSEQLAYIPGAEKVRLNLLKDSVDFYQDIIDQKANDPALDANNPQLNADLALANSKIGDLKAKMGYKNEALVSQEHARALWQNLVAEVTTGPDNADYQRSLALCNNNIGTLLMSDLGRPGDAIEALKEAESAQRKLLAANSQSTDLAIDLATTDNNLGLASKQIHVLDEGASRFREAISRLEQLQLLLPKDDRVLQPLAATYINLASLEESSDTADAADLYSKAVTIQEQLSTSDHTYVRDLARTYNNLGSLASRNKDWQRAEQYYLKAMKIQDAMAKASPSDGSIRSDLSVCYNNLGMMQSQEKEFAGAEASFSHAFELQRVLLRSQPEDVQLLSNLGGVHNNLGMLYDRQGRLADADAEYRKAIDSQRQAFERAPDSSVFRELLSKHYFNYARNLREQRKPAEAAEVTLERKKLWPGESDRLYSVAQELTAACQAMATTPQSATEAQQKYWQAAVDTLRDAVAAGLPIDRLDDPSLKALSDREDFRKLLVETHTDQVNSNGSGQALVRQLN